MPTATDPYGEAGVGIGNLDIYRDPNSTEEERLAECKKVAESLIVRRFPFPFTLYPIPT